MQLNDFLDRDDSAFSEALATELCDFVKSLEEPLEGLALVAGDDCSVDYMLIAYSPRSTDRSWKDRLTGERFDVASWTFESNSLPKTHELLDALNLRFRSIHPKNDEAIETDQAEDAHVAKLHRSILDGFKLAVLRDASLASGNLFKTIYISDSELKIDLVASKELNSVATHAMYRAWR